jgi:hypothetical protein
MSNQGGTIQVDAPTELFSSNVEQISGTTNLNNTLELNTGSQFKLSGGTLNVGTGMIAGSGNNTAFHYLGGTISGPLTIDGTGLTVGPSITGPFSFSFRGNSRVTLSNNLLAAGQLLTLQPGGLPGGAILTSATGFTNQSSIVLHPGTSSTTFWISNSEILLNDTNGLIRVAPASEVGLFSSRIRANILNRGTVSIESPTVYEKINSVFTNDGEFTATATFTFDSGRSFKQIGGSSLINASVGGPSADMPADFSGGRLLGNGTLIFPVINTGASVEPGDNGVGNLSVVGSYVQQSGGSLIAEIGGSASNQHDVLAVTGPATLGGTLDVRLVDLGVGIFAPSAGQTFQILTATGGVSNRFDSYLFPPLPSDLAWSVDYGTSAVTLTVASVPEPSAILMCIVGLTTSLCLSRIAKKRCQEPFIAIWCKLRYIPPHGTTATSC